MNLSQASSVTKHHDVDSNITVYHIYHSGSKDSKSYSIHLVSDSNAPLIDEYEHTNQHGSTEKGLLHGEQSLLRRQSTWSSLVTKAKRAKAYDKLKYDPRTQSSPYFLHSPILVFHRLPYTLRYGGNFKAPVAALLHVALGWRKWKLEFGDVLSQEGVIDGRGVVSLDYGTKSGEDGTLKGYRLRSFRFPGKAWFKERKALGEQNTETHNESAIKAKPEEVVELRWASPLLRPREYVFFWRGFKFIWYVECLSLFDTLSKNPALAKGISNTKLWAPQTVFDS
jgi:hypothetical protein